MPNTAMGVTAPSFGGNVPTFHATPGGPPTYHGPFGVGAGSALSPEFGQSLTQGMTPQQMGLYFLQGSGGMGPFGLPMPIAAGMDMGVLPYMQGGGLAAPPKPAIDPKKFMAETNRQTATMANTGVSKIPNLTVNPNKPMIGGPQNTMPDLAGLLQQLLTQGR